MRVAFGHSVPAPFYGEKTFTFTPDFWRAVETPLPPYYRLHVFNRIEIKDFDPNDPLPINYVEYRLISVEKWPWGRVGKIESAYTLQEGSKT